MYMTLMTMSMIMSMMFPMMKHPLSLGLILILQTLIISLISGMMINTFWFSYILTMTLLSGALVLFIYMASIASNEKFSSSIKMLIYMMIMIMCMMPTMLYLTLKNNILKEKLMTKFNFMSSLIKLFNIHNLTLTIFLVLYLLLTMIIISYIVDNKEGPLRMKN
uniref:NADH dehydrogenase subunit 6 n=1 Tax=Ectrychotes andreae TaxID=204515 RepID=A0A7I6HBT5_9HEMI|nr:NADH dehydrogenase subunit 6 [Ectrychotes andreae]